jgi:hypothetical protein
VLIFGALGFGKTHLAIALWRAIVEAAALRERPGPPGGAVQSRTDGQLSDRLMFLQQAGCGY